MNKYLFLLTSPLIVAIASGSVAIGGDATVALWAAASALSVFSAYWAFDATKGRNASLQNKISWWWHFMVVSSWLGLFSWFVGLFAASLLTPHLGPILGKLVGWAIPACGYLFMGWMQDESAYETASYSSGGNSGYSSSNDFSGKDEVNATVINPSTGLPMMGNHMGGFDVGGNAWCQQPSWSESSFNNTSTSYHDPFNNNY